MQISIRHMPLFYLLVLSSGFAMSLPACDLLAAESAAEKLDAQPLRVDCEGRYPGHLQGVCLDDEGNIYWSFTTRMVKTDAQGKLLKEVPAVYHHGDLCYVEGQVYVAVNLGRFNDPAGKADGWIYVYDVENLKEVARHAVPQVKHGAGGMAWRDGRFIVVGGLPHEVDENYLYEYDRDFKFIKKHVLASGHTHLGIQGAAASIDGKWWFACYGEQLLVTNNNFEMEGRYTFECGYGIVGLGGDRFYIARGSCQKPEGCRGYLLLAEPDAATGLKVVEE